MCVTICDRLAVERDVTVRITTHFSNYKQIHFRSLICVTCEREIFNVSMAILDGSTYILKTMQGRKLPEKFTNVYFHIHVTQKNKDQRPTSYKLFMNEMEHEPPNTGRPEIKCANRIKKTFFQV